MPAAQDRALVRPLPLGALSCPPFARLLSGQVVSQVGTQMSNAAAAWILYRLTHSALALGAQGLCFSLPIAILPMCTGILADRFNRLSLVKVTLAAEAAQAFGLAAVTATGNLHPWMLYLAAVADAGRLAVNIPAQSALVPAIVPPRLLFSALALSGSTWSSSALVGPAAAGALLAVAGPGVIFAVNGACTLIALGAVITLRTFAQPPRNASGPPRIADGFTWLRAHRPVAWLQGVLTVSMTGALAVETLLPVFAADAWHTGPAGYGLLRMTPGIAAIVTGIGLPMVPSAVRHPLTLPAAFAAAGAAIAAFAMGPPFILALFLLAAGSLALTVTQVTASTIIQQSTPDVMRGRITALGSAGQNGLAGLAAAATAGLAAGAGPRLATAVMAAVTAGGGIPLALLARQPGDGGTAPGLRPGRAPSAARASRPAARPAPPR